MLIIGERINTSRKGIASLVENRDEQSIVEMARLQKEAGADFIDANCGTLLGSEAESLEWLVRTIQSQVETPVSLDSPNPEAIRRALAVHRGKALLNSISMEKERLEGLLPLVREYRCSVVALAMDDNGIPESVEDRYQVVSRLVEALTGVGLSLDDIYVDPLVQPVSTGENSGMMVIETIRRIKASFPGIHTVCGLSNISYGLPERKLLNQAFLLFTMEAGLDAAILDPLDRRLMSLIWAGEALLGKDAYCRNYLTAFRNGLLTGVSE